jgi:hypothetical protein
MCTRYCTSRPEVHQHERRVVVYLITTQIGPLCKTFVFSDNLNLKDMNDSGEKINLKFNM